MKDLDPAHPGQLGDSTGKLGQNGFFPRSQLGRLDGWRSKSNAAVLRFARRNDRVGGIKQRLGRNAAAVETDAAEPFVPLDQDHFLAQIGGVKGRGVAAGTGANHDNLSFSGVHEKKSRPARRAVADSHDFYFCNSFP